MDTCKFISLSSKAGIVFNKKKFQFGSDKVEFLGFIVNEDSVRPSDKFLGAIQDFPRPRDITGIRSWFGLVNQCNFAFSQSDLMLPFRNLLKPSTEFLWTPELQEAFEHSKLEIQKAVEKGVRTYDMGRSLAWPLTGRRWGSASPCCRRSATARTSHLCAAAQVGPLYLRALASPAGRRADTRR